MGSEDRRRSVDKQVNSFIQLYRGYKTSICKGGNNEIVSFRVSHIKNLEKFTDVAEVIVKERMPSFNEIVDKTVAIAKEEKDDIILSLILQLIELLINYKNNMVQ